MQFLTNVDMCGNELKNAVVENLSVPPVTPKEGQFYYDTRAHTLYVFANGKWTDALAPNYKLPVAGKDVLGGIKVGNNLSITPDGVLSANDNPTSYLVKQQRFVAAENQTEFILTTGTYRVGIGALSVFVNGAKQSAGIIKENSSTSFSLPKGLAAGTVVLAEYIELIDVEPYPTHAREHMADGADPIPNATEEAAGLMSPADKQKLEQVTEEELGRLAGIQSNVQNQLNGKAEKSHGNHVPKTETANGRRFLRNDNTWQTLPDASVMESGIVQLNDATNSTSTSQAATANAVKKAFDKASHSHPYIQTNQKGAAGGVAELDAAGKVPSSQLPGFVDDVIEGYMSGGKFYEEAAHTTLITGESGKIYVDLTTNRTYRWSGTKFAEISSSLALGETSSTAYRGDRGKIAYEHSQVEHVTGIKGEAESTYRKGNVNITKENVGLGNVPNVSTNNQTVTYTMAAKLEELVSNEKMHIAFGKLQKAVHEWILHFQDKVSHITSDERESWNSRARKYSANIGNGTLKEITVTHGLNTQDVTILVRKTAAPYSVILCDIEIISATQIKLIFAMAPAANEYRVIVTG